MNCQKDDNLRFCPCTWPDCPRRGICCQCLRHHLEKDELPACCFPPETEKTYDRSIKNFVACHQDI
ncbi:MAG: DUF6485 family protein [Patescibacteria group bacterium]